MTLLSTLSFTLPTLTILPWTLQELSSRLRRQPETSSTLQLYSGFSENLHQVPEDNRRHRMAIRPHPHKPNGYNFTLPSTLLLYFTIYFTYFNDFTLNSADIIYHRVPEDSRRPYHHWSLQIQLEIFSISIAHSLKSLKTTRDDIWATLPHYKPHGFILILTLIFTIMLHSL